MKKKKTKIKRPNYFWHPGTFWSLRDVSQTNTRMKTSETDWIRHIESKNWHDHFEK